MGECCKKKEIYVDNKYTLENKRRVMIIHCRIYTSDNA
jgi:hypothetical protein